MTSAFIDFFRASAPYIHAHRGRTMVIAAPGDIFAEERHHNFLRDLALLNSLGIGVVLVASVEYQVEHRIGGGAGGHTHWEPGDNAVDIDTLRLAKEAMGDVRVEIEARLSMGLANTPLARARMRVASGNFLTAMPLGVRDGLDYGYAGKVRRVDHESIAQRLSSGAIVVIQTMGYSLTGDPLVLSLDDVAAATAIALRAYKLIFLTPDSIRQGETDALVPSLKPDDIADLLDRSKVGIREKKALLACAKACREGVERSHLLRLGIEGGILLELFTASGAGTLVDSHYEFCREASLADVPALESLVTPLEGDVLIPRPRRRLESTIGRFVVTEREHAIVACAEIVDCDDGQSAELGCLVVKPEYRGQGCGDRVLEYVESRCRERRLMRLFALTTRTSEWFLERGFEQVAPADLPLSRQKRYSKHRNSRVLCKHIR